MKAAERGGLVLEEEQREAFRHVTSGPDLSLVVGYAGSGKSTMLGVARAAWEAEGYTVRGAALSGIAAEGLERGAGIASRTIASLEYAWKEGRDQLSSRDVLVVDEAGMIGSRQAGLGQTRAFVLDLRRLAYLPLTAAWFPRAGEEGGKDDLGIGFGKAEPYAAALSSRAPRLLSRCTFVCGKMKERRRCFTDRPCS